MNEQNTWVIESVAEVSVEDGGQAMIAEINEETEDADGVFVRFQSWVEDCHSREQARKRHPIAHLSGRRVRITVEVLD